MANLCHSLVRWISVLVFCVSGMGGWSCVPELDVDESVVASTRLIAVTSEPAEPALGETVTWTAWFASAGVTDQEPLVVWDLCTRRPPLAQAGSVDLRCLEALEGAVVAAGEGRVVSTVLPQDACSRFGPDPPPVEAGQTAGRAAIPDSTGGYQQAAVARWETGSERAVTSVAQRIRCGLAAATQAEAAEFRRQYIPNQNPGGLELRAFDEAGRELPFSDDSVLTVQPGQTVDLALSWPACVSGTPCGGREFFVRFDTASRTLVQQRESMRVQWLATSSGFRFARTGVGPLLDDQEEVANQFVAPLTPGLVSIWIIARDGRGGAAVIEARLQVAGGI